MEGVWIQAPLPCSSNGLSKTLSTSAASFPSVHLAAHLIEKLQLGNISKSKLYSLDEAAPHSAAHLFLFNENMRLWEISHWSFLCSHADLVSVVVFHTLRKCEAGSASQALSAVCSRDTVAAETSWRWEEVAEAAEEEKSCFVGSRRCLLFTENGSESVYTKRKAGTSSWENTWIVWGPAWGERVVGTDSCLGHIITGPGSEVLEILAWGKKLAER